MNVTSIGAPLPPTPERSGNVPTPAQVSQTREIAQAVQRVNQGSILPDNREISLSLDPATKLPVLRLVDAATRQVIEQVPAEYILRLSAFFDSQQAAQEKTK